MSKSCFACLTTQKCKNAHKRSSDLYHNNVNDHQLLQKQWSTCAARPAASSALGSFPPSPSPSPSACLWVSEQSAQAPSSSPALSDRTCWTGRMWWGARRDINCADVFSLIHPLHLCPGVLQRDAVSRWSSLSCPPDPYLPLTIFTWKHKKSWYKFLI